MYPNPIGDKAEALILEELRRQQKPLSLDNLAELLNENQIIDARKHAKESIWDLSEHGLIRFTKNWWVEIKPPLPPSETDSFYLEGVAPPNTFALKWCLITTNVALEMGLIPSRILPSIEEGLAVSFIREDRYCDIECFNSGSIVAVTSDRVTPDVWQVKRDEEDIRRSLIKIASFLKGSECLDTQMIGSV